VVLFMQAKTAEGTESKRDIGLDEELADVLIAISVISKRLARKLTEQLQQEQSNMKGENKHEQDE
jgi:NTP pyrophosphatase (non-canonical NTP hydrolase)